MTGDPLTVLREALGLRYELDSDAEVVAALDDVEALVVAARRIVYPFDFAPDQPLDEWRGSELLRALARFPATSPAKEQM